MHIHGGKDMQFWPLGFFHTPRDMRILRFLRSILMLAARLKVKHEILNQRQILLPILVVYYLQNTSGRQLLTHSQHGLQHTHHPR